MAVDIHIKIDTIPGMSEVKGFEGQIKVESFGWGHQWVQRLSRARLGPWIGSSTTIV